MQTHPLPSTDELKFYYDGFAFLPPNLDQAEPHFECISASLRYHVGESAGLGRFLDYGGGYGLYALAASRIGWEVSLFDYDSGALEFANERLGLARCLNRTDHLERESFDVIWAFHVIEHFQDLRSSFNEIDRLLRPGGIIVVATPNARSWEKYLRLGHFKNYWFAWRKRGLGRIRLMGLLLRYDSVFCWDPPRHLYAFTPASLQEVGSMMGYETEIRTGCNLEVVFEPRRYVMGDLGAKCRSLFRELLRRPWRPGIWLALIHTAVVCTGFGLLRRVAPAGGEQLYAIFKKPE